MPTPRTSGEWFSGRIPVSVIPTVPSRLPPRPPSSFFDADSLDDISLEDEQELLVIDVNGATRKSMILIVEPAHEGDSRDVHIGGQEPTLTTGGLKTDPSFVFIPGKQPGKPGRWWRIRKVVALISQKIPNKPSKAAKDNKKDNHVRGLFSRGKKAISGLKATIRAHKPAEITPVEVPPPSDNRRLEDETAKHQAQVACNKHRSTPLNLQKPLPPLPPVQPLSQLRIPLKTRSEPPHPRKPMIISRPIGIRSRKCSICDFATSPASAGLDTPRNAPPMPTTPRHCWSPLGDGMEIDPEVNWMSLG